MEMWWSHQCLEMWMSPTSPWSLYPTSLPRRVSWPLVEGVLVELERMEEFPTQNLAAESECLLNSMGIRSFVHLVSLSCTFSLFLIISWCLCSCFLPSLVAMDIHFIILPVSLLARYLCIFKFLVSLSWWSVIVSVWTRKHYDATRGLSEFVLIKYLYFWNLRLFIICGLYTQLIMTNTFCSDAKSDSFPQNSSFWAVQLDEPVQKANS